METIRVSSRSYSFFLKTDAEIFQIFCRLSVFCKAGELCLVFLLLKVCGSYQFQLFLACHDVHGKFFEISQILLVHLIQYGDVLEQLTLMSLQGVADFIDIDLGFFVFCLHRGEFVAAAFEEGEWTLLFLRGVKSAELCDNACQKVADLAEILAAYIFQCFFGKIRHLFLSAGSILKDAVSVIQIDL